MDTPESAERWMTDGADFSVLSGPDAYARYMTLLNKAFRLLEKSEQVRNANSPAQAVGGTYETAFIQSMTRRLLNTVEALSMKYAFSSPDTGDRLYIDLTESGMPNYLDITAIQTDLIDRDTILDSMPSLQALKQHALNHLFSEKTEPLRVLATIGRRTYLEKLRAEDVFLPFVMGPLARWQQGDKTNQRGYLISWGCYDSQANMPFLHIMHFEQDANEPELEEGGENLQALMHVIKSEGSRAPEKLFVLAAAIDQALEPIHPKLLKRIRIGPLYAPLLLKEKPENQYTEVEKCLKEIFDISTEDDFALLFNEDIVFSMKQKITQSFFKKVVREAFHLPQLDDDANEAGSSLPPQRNILMPHRILQVMRPDQADRLPGFAKRIKFVYDKQEQIHEIR